MNIVIDKKFIGRRIDKFLKEEVFFNFPLTRGDIIKNIKAGNVLVNEKVTKPSYSLKLNDKLQINIKETSKQILPNDEVFFEIIHQDKNILIINKPAGLQVHPSEKNEPDTLVNGLLAKFPEIKNVGDTPEIRPGIVHRLDRDTSGLMIITLNQKSFLELKKMFQNHQIKKTYWAIVSGNFSKQAKEGLIEAPLARAANYKKQVVAGRKTATKIRPAITHYKILKDGPAFSLVEVRLETGRMHQIRVHMSHIGHPLAGDRTYGRKQTKNQGLNRHLLHAKRLEFELFREKFSFECEPPQDFQKFLDENIK